MSYTCAAAELVRRQAGTPDPRAGPAQKPSAIVPWGFAIIAAAAAGPFAFALAWPAAAWNPSYDGIPVQLFDHI